jgi:hypothetical protein
MGFKLLQVIWLLLSLSAVCSAGEVLSEPDEKLFRGLEEERLRGLVGANMESFDRFHAKDYQLISPVGMPFSFDEYRSAIGTGKLDYLVWEIGGSFQSRIYERVAVLRYQAKLEFAWEGKKFPAVYLWHTDVYEKRSGVWVVVWSQATQIN